MTTTIWHNPRCSKSRQTLALLQENGIDPAVRLYLQDIPTPDELRAALSMLGVSAAEFIRNGEAIYSDAGLGADDDEDNLIAAMVEFPKLIERPIVFHENRAAIGRPPENVLKLF